MEKGTMIIHKDSGNMKKVKDESVSLIVTSPPYPMIKMWDEMFKKINIETYKQMHDYLERTWKECYRVIKPGRIMAINIGDATRKVNNNFQLFSNHSEIINRCQKLGFILLPFILWKKPTTKPNSFLGGGFYPPNAYVTQECEFILLFRKGNKQSFKQREDSKYTFEERNKWFSQIWEIPGRKQNGNATFPEEIPTRLIRMFSFPNEIVLDPFAGTGTTIKVAEELNRKGVGYEIKVKGDAK